MIVDYTELARSYHLVLERESAAYWTVSDGDTVMMRSPDRELCARFMRAFAEREANVTLDHSWRVAQMSNVHFLFHEQAS